jgi:hypothetical protein
MSNVNYTPNNKNDFLCTTWVNLQQNGDQSERMYVKEMSKIENCGLSNYFFERTLPTMNFTVKNVNKITEHM